MSEQSVPTAAASPFVEEALAQLEVWDPKWAHSYREMCRNPWNSGVLSTRLVELTAVAISVACTNLNMDGARRHIRSALAAGATRDEILCLIKMASVMAIHSCSLGAPILIDEAGADLLAASAKEQGATPACDQMKTIGQWNAAWDPFFKLAPDWTDQFMATGAGIYGSGIFTAKETELLSIAFDASFTHMYAPGTRRHIKNALSAGASVAEIMEVLKICVVLGVEATNLAVPILADELARAKA
jgi:alkylhydroperoxidase/carboxymuconolactone decarboxylase family protein YurZ